MGVGGCGNVIGASVLRTWMLWLMHGAGSEGAVSASEGVVLICGCS